MGAYIIRRLLTAIPTLLVISFVIFAILDLAPGDPTGNLPLTIKPEVREAIREALGYNKPFHIRYFKWPAGSLFAKTETEKCNRDFRWQR